NWCNRSSITQLVDTRLHMTLLSKGLVTISCKKPGRRIKCHSHYCRAQHSANIRTYSSRRAPIATTDIGGPASPKKCATPIQIFAAEQQVINP
ncbi:hypothetical protein, partial [Arhodomonas sp. AD133]|uniref:hypothetical protein n=1 Tax=Arhodomonas sp. AD133 TaxID=3415009 RepID=UPI003EB956F7